MSKPQEIPQHLTDRITERGGLAANGKPLFRVVWGPEVMEVRGQEWKDRDASGNIIRTVCEYRKEQKYTCERWVFEMWTPPELSEEEWTFQYTEFFDGLPLLKLPYPHDGEYECVKVIETPCNCKFAFESRGRKWDGHCRFPNHHNTFVPLTSTICDVLIATAIANRHIPAARKMEYLKQRRVKKEEEKDRKVLDILADRLGPFGSAPHVTVLK